MRRLARGPERRVQERERLGELRDDARELPACVDPEFRVAGVEPDVRQRVQCLHGHIVRGIEWAGRSHRGP